MALRHKPGAGIARLQWAAAIALSGAASIAVVRLATPLTLDESATEALLFFAVPGLIVLLLGRILKPAGLILAMAFPVMWFFLSKDSNDSALLWCVPVAAAVAILYLSRRSATKPFIRGAAAAAGLLAASALFWPTGVGPNAGVRLVLIGWDGATWDVIDPLVAEGRMPNLARLTEGGHRAKLRSLPSLFSPEVWTTICTGCMPEVHGIYGWTNRKSDLAVGRIWDQLKLEGRSFGVCDWYFTWPPDPGDKDRDFIIPTHLAPDYLTFPEDYFFYRVAEDFHKLKEKENVHKDMRVLASAGIEAWRHGVRLSTIRRSLAEIVMRELGKRDKLDRKWRNRRLYTSLESDLFAELLRTRGPEFAAVLFTQIDTVCHAYWKYMEPEGFDEVTASDIERYGRVIPDVYAEADRGLGKILEIVPEDADVLIVSDHGFQALGEKIAGKSCRIRALKLIESIGLQEKMFGTNVGDKVYLWAIAGTREEKQAILARAEPALRETRIIGEGHPLFTVSRAGESIHLAIAPRDTLPEESSIIIDDREVPFRRIIRAASVPTESGNHHPDGIYLLQGPSAAVAVRSDSLHVTDVAPTIAAILGLPASPLWTGRPAIRAASMRVAAAEDYPPPAGIGEEPERVSEDLIERLRALGYLE